MFAMPHIAGSQMQLDDRDKDTSADSGQGEGSSANILFSTAAVFCIFNATLQLLCFSYNSATFYGFFNAILRRFLVLLQLCLILKGFKKNRTLQCSQFFLQLLLHSVPFLAWSGRQQYVFYLSYASSIYKSGRQTQREIDKLDNQCVCVLHRRQADFST